MKVRTLIRATTLLTVICLFFSTASCSDVPASYRVDTGIFPTYQDDEVRFRTTYYLRVFDLCPIDDSETVARVGITEANRSPDEHGSYIRRMEVFTSRQSGSLRLVKDSLLRFRMTGQASALYSDLHFESGVLGADEIDPFGRTVDYNDAKKKFETFNAALQGDGATRIEVNRNTDKCPSGEPLARRFYLLGPEGIRELDPNDRLIMAMYTNAKPLINSLKHLAGQRANADAEQLWPFDRELSKARAESALSLLRDKEAFAKETMGLPSPKHLGDRLLPLFGKESVH